MNQIQLKRCLLSLTAAAGLCFTAPVFAGGPLNLCASGQPFVWGFGGSNIPFNPDQGDLGPVDNAAAVALVQQAFDVWGAVPTSTASYTNAGSLPVDVDITNFAAYLNAPAPDGLSAIVFDDTGEIFDQLFGPNSGVLGFAGPEFADTTSCEITEGGSFLNGPAFADATAALDVMVHEFGHYSNLGHTVVNGQQYINLGDTSGPHPDDPFPAPPPFGAELVETMYPFYYGPGIGTQTLHLDDIASLSTLYPDPSFTATTAAISGTIFAPDKSTKVSGVNVIARNEADPYMDAVSAISGDFTDDFSQSDPIAGTYIIEGLTPGADYRVYIDELLAGSFSTPPASPLIGPEEYYNGRKESNNEKKADPPLDFKFVNPGASGIDIDIIFNTPRPGDPLNVGDDGNVQLSLPFRVRICGERYNTVFVNANGSLTFGEASEDFSESTAEFLSGPPRIAGLWDDLNPTAGGIVTFSQNKNRFKVIWQDIPEFPAVGSNTFSITLRRNSNHINLDYGDISAEDGLAGVSCGGAITSGFENPTDLSAERGRINLHRQPAVFELFAAGNPNDLANSRVRFTGTSNYTDRWAEPNNTPARARRIRLPFNSIPINRFTEIDPTGADVDFYRFDLTAGNTLLAEIISGQLDTIMMLMGPDGSVVDADDDGGAGILSRIQYSIPVSGRYILGVSTFDDFDFTGDGNSGGRYVLDVQEINGILLSLGDDDSEEVTLPFSFPFQGSVWTSIFINSNGNLTFGSGDTDSSESVAELLSGQPRIAPLWEDLSPDQGGNIIVESDTGSLTVSFEAVPEFLAGNDNTFAVTLFDTGSYSIFYGNIDASGGLAGSTEGGGAADPGETDLSAAGTLPAVGTTYELFSGVDNDLSAESLNFNP